MTNLRQLLIGGALLLALLALVWGQQQRINAADGRVELSAAYAQHSQQAAESAVATATTLQAQLNNERKNQTDLRSQQDQLRSALSTRQQQIKELQRENQALRDWAAQQLPTAARELRERPSLTGAHAYHQWLSGRSALPPASHNPAE